MDSACVSAMAVEYEHLGSLITIKGTDRCLGYLFHAEGHGVFDPIGRHDIDPKYVEPHNKALSQAEIKGLDENCQVGQGATFYLTDDKQSVRTWHGDIVSVLKGKRPLQFVLKGKVFQGERSGGSNDTSIFFKRIV